MYAAWRSPPTSRSAGSGGPRSAGADDADVDALVAELRADAEFETRWSAHPVGEKRRGAKRAHASGRSATSTWPYEVLALPDDGDQRLVTWLPADDATAEHLHTLLSGVPVAPRSARVVGER